MPRDQPDPYADVSTTPFWDFAVGMSLIVLTLGGGLAFVYAVGYLATGQPELAWPPAVTFCVLLAVHLLFRHARGLARGRDWAAPPEPPSRRQSRGPDTRT